MVTGVWLVGVVQASGSRDNNESSQPDPLCIHLKLPRPLPLLPALLSSLSQPRVLTSFFPPPFINLINIDRVSVSSQVEKHRIWISELKDLK